MQLLPAYFYKPSYEENNEATIRKFQKLKVPIEKIQASLGRRKRFIINNDHGPSETVMTMAEQAAAGAIAGSSINVQDIDLIIFITSFPEQSVPCGALYIHKAIQAKPHTLCYDLNASCIGAFIALEQAYKYLTHTPGTSKALIVSGEHFSRVEDEDNPVTAFSFTDSAFALIISKDNSPSGYVDSRYFSDPAFSETIKFPQEGFSHNRSLSPKLFWGRFDGMGSVTFMYDELTAFLAKNGLLLSDISLFLFSQFSYRNIELIQEYFRIPEEKIPVICFDLAYTGASSPFLALHEYLRNGGTVQKGSYLLIWTLGAGYQAGMMLWRY